METNIFYYLLPLLLLPLSIYFISIALIKASADQKNLPPGSESEGWPILGEYIDYAISGTHQFIRGRMQKYSPHVFKTGTMLFGEKMAVLCGEEGNKLIFKNEAKLFTTWLLPSRRKLVHPESVDISASNESKAMNC